MPWNDQPEEAQSKPMICEIRVKGVLVEVRGEVGGPYFLTAGDLFRSETIECKDAHAALAALNRVNGR